MAEEQTTEPTESAAEKPPWGDDFDPEKAWKLVQGLKADKAKLAARPVLTDEAKAKLAEHDALVEASKSELDKANEALARWQTESEKWRTSAVSSKIQALASDFVDPTDALSELDPSIYLDAGGSIDESRIKADLAEVLERKTHWRRHDDDPAPRPPAPNAAQGSSARGAPTTDPAAQLGAIFNAALK